ncbi:MAG: CopG family antitoxin [Patescibacteria group bacterium]
MKYFELDQEEKNILHELDEGNFVVLNKKDNERYTKYARTILDKAKNINIRLSDKDLQKVKARAVSKGIPYQTLVTSVIHQYVNDEVEMRV